MLAIDDAQARAFLGQLAATPEDTAFLFQTFTDSKSVRAGMDADPLARTFYGTWDQLSSVLNALQNKGAGVFVQIQQGQKRGKAHVTGSRALFVDADTPPVIEVLNRLKGVVPAPNMVIESSAGKMHLYWCMTDVPKDMVRTYLTAIACVGGTDVNACTLDRVMRLPGSWHLKDLANPQQVMLRKVSNHAVQLVPFMEAIMNAPQVVQDVVQKVNKSSKNPFGIDVADYVEPEELSSGDRTGKLIAHIGHLSATGYGPDYIADEIRRMNQEMCAEGTDPIPEERLKIEVLGAIKRFSDNETGPTTQAMATQVVAPAQPMLNPFVSAPVEPAPAPAPFQSQIVEAELTVGSVNPLAPIHVQAMPLSRAMSQPNTTESWLARFALIVKSNRCMDMMSGESFTQEELKALSANKKVGESTLFAQWFKNKDRAEATRTVFLPGSDRVLHHKNNLEVDINIFRPVVSTIDAADYDESKIKLFLDHIDQLFVEEKERDIFLDWLAFTVQYPQYRCTWAPVLQSEQGTGKTWIMEVLQRVMATASPSYMAVVEPAVLEKNFNGYLSEKLVVVFEEIHTRNRYDLGDKLKTVVNAKLLEVEKKNIEACTEQIFANIIAFTQWADAIALKDDDRRFWVVNVDHDMARNARYFKPLFDWVEDESAIDQLRHYLCEVRDVSQFDYGVCPDATETKLEMIAESLSDIESAMVSMIRDQRRCFKCDLVDLECAVVAVAMELAMEVTANLRRDVKRALNQQTKRFKRLMVDGRGYNLRSVRQPIVWSKRNSVAQREEFLSARKCNLGDETITSGRLSVVGDEDGTG